MSDLPQVLIPHLLIRQKSEERAKSVAMELRTALPDVNVRIASSRNESLKLAQKAEIIVCKGVTNEFLDAATNLHWIQALSSGLDRFITDKYGYEPPGLDRLEREGIILTNLAGIMAEPMAEQAFGYLLAIERNFTTAIRKQDAHEWGEFNPDGELQAKTIGIVGLGSVGTRVAELSDAFDMNVIGTKRSTDEVPDAVDEVYGADELETILPRSDYLLVSCPLTDETRGLIGADELSILPDHAIIVNVARGAIINQDALITALEEGTIRGAGLDVFETEPLPTDSPLWNQERAILTPHFAGQSSRTDERAARLFARNYERFLNEELDTLENRII